MRKPNGPAAKRMIGRFIVADPAICHGQPTFRGTRILVRGVLEQVASGIAWETIVEEWRYNVPQEAVSEAISLASACLNNSGLVILRRVLRSCVPSETITYVSDSRYSEANGGLRRACRIYDPQLQDHLRFKLFGSLTKMCFTMIGRTQSNHVCNPVRTILCESNYVVRLQIPRSIWLDKARHFA